MYIMTEKCREIINSEFVERFCVVEKEDAVLIVASYNDVRRAVTMARYRDKKEAEWAMGELMGALSGGSTYFYMPDSVLHWEEHIKKDARTKRRGGS